MFAAAVLAAVVAIDAGVWPDEQELWPHEFGWPSVTTIMFCLEPDVTLPLYALDVNCATPAVIPAAILVPLQAGIPLVLQSPKLLISLVNVTSLWPVFGSIAGVRTGLFKATLVNILSPSCELELAFVCMQFIRALSASCAFLIEFLKDAEIS